MLAHQIAQAATKRKSTDARVRNLASGCCQPVSLCRGVELAPQYARRGDCLSRGGVYRDTLHCGKVDHQPVFTYGCSRNTVTTASNT